MFWKMTVKQGYHEKWAYALVQGAKSVASASKLGFISSQFLTELIHHTKS